MINKERVYSKVNLSLQVLSKREDNRHNLHFVSVPCSLYDEIVVKPSKENKIVFKNLELGLESNIGKILIFLQEKYSIPTLDIYIEDNVPARYGLGSSSLAAAALLKYVQRVYELPSNELEQIGFMFGSDIPCILRNRAVSVTGAGENVENIILPKLYCLLYLPKYTFSTKEVFQSLNKVKKENKADTKAFIKEINSSKQSNFKYLKNDLQDAVEYLSPEFKKEFNAIKSIAKDAVMSGSGSSIVCVYKDKNTALEKQTLLAEKGFKTLYFQS